ncbi:hypothetical protein ACIPSA_15635 [Streptomyces sp. NPDC086549]|uniref:hypothetical protein n=1 Tax=Streptomyces sp. NPDC086549 TaxID=3365752 RepID=UPI0037F109BA
MSEPRDHEPVFIRKWGRSYYNTRNPIGLALTIGSLLFAAGGIYYVEASSKWSEGELRTAVHEAATALEKKQVVDDEYTGFTAYIDEAIDATGKGPSTGAVVDQVSPTSDDYTITGPGTDAAFCMHIQPTPVNDTYATLTVQVEDGAC